MGSYFIKLSGIGISRNTIKGAMQKGAVWYQRGKQTQRIRRQDRHLHAGDQLFIYYNQQVLAQHCPKAELLADKGEFSVWYKPSGMLSQGSRWSDHCTINRWAETHIQPQRPAFIVNRLDRAAQGLMLISHSKAMARELSRHFEDHSIHKAYIAVVVGIFSEDQSCNLDVNGKPASSHIYVLSHTTKYSLVKVVIETGRKHQIRTHLAALGHPILGDRLFQSGSFSQDLALACTELSWQDAAGTHWQFTLPKCYIPALPPSRA